MKKILPMISLLVLMILLSSSTTIVSQGVPPADLSRLKINQNSDITTLQNRISVTNSGSSSIIAGLNLFATQRQDAGINGFNQGDVVITDMEGNIMYSLSSPGSNRMTDPEMINSTTVFLRDNNPLFWNYETNVTEYFPFEAGGHDMEYNPFTDTFLVKQWSDLGNVSGLQVRYNDLFEIDREGNVVWYWNSTEHFPFNQELADGLIQRGRLVWMHANSLFWDYENDVIYLGARGHDTFYKIDKTTGDVIWGLGKLGNFTLYDINGNEKVSLFYHQHAVELISENKFILYDNDFMNTSRENPEEGISRMVEIEIDESKMEAYETFVYTAPADYFGEPWGDADVLPGGNRLGAFGHVSHDAHITEVNETGDIVWELNIGQTEDNQWGIYRAERFYEGPVISKSTLSSDNLFTVYFHDNVKLRHDRAANFKITQDDDLKYSTEIFLKRHFQENSISIDLDTLDLDDTEFTVIISNEDGKITAIQATKFVAPVESNVDTPLNSLYLFTSFAVLEIIRRKRKQAEFILQCI